MLGLFSLSLELRCFASATWDWNWEAEELALAHIRWTTQHCDHLMRNAPASESGGTQTCDFHMRI